MDAFLEVYKVWEWIQEEIENLNISITSKVIEAVIYIFPETYSPGMNVSQRIQPNIWIRSNTYLKLDKMAEE